MGLNPQGSQSQVKPFDCAQARPGAKYKGVDSRPRSVSRASLGFSVPRKSGLRRTKSPPYRLLRSEFCFGESHILFVNCINRHLVRGRALVWPIFLSHLRMLLDRLFLLFLYILCKDFSIAVHVFHNNFFYILAAAAETVLHPGPSMLLLYFYL